MEKQRTQEAALREVVSDLKKQLASTRQSLQKATTARDEAVSRAEKSVEEASVAQRGLDAATKRADHWEKATREKEKELKKLGEEAGVLRDERDALASEAWDVMGALWGALGDFGVRADPPPHPRSDGLGSLASLRHGLSFVSETVSGYGDVCAQTAWRLAFLLAHQAGAGDHMFRKMRERITELPTDAGALQDSAELIHPVERAFSHLWQSSGREMATALSLCSLSQRLAFLGSPRLTMLEADEEMLLVPGSNDYSQIVMAALDSVGLGVCAICA